MLERIVLQGYKSIREANVRLRPINVLIGANDSGKSNFISLFLFMNRLVNQGMQMFVAQAGGANQILHYGQKITERLSIEFWFSSGGGKADGYSCTLIPTAEDPLLFEEEVTYFHDRVNFDRPYIGQSSYKVHEESMLANWADSDNVAKYILQPLRSWRVYHFHDTTEWARAKQ